MLMAAQRDNDSLSREYKAASRTLSKLIDDRNKSEVSIDGARGRTVAHECAKNLDDRTRYRVRKQLELIVREFSGRKTKDVRPIYSFRIKCVRL